LSGCATSVKQIEISSKPIEKPSLTLPAVAKIKKYYQNSQVALDRANSEIGNVNDQTKKATDNNKGWWPIGGE